MAGTGTACQPHWIATAADTRVWWDLPGLLKLPQKNQLCQAFASRLAGSVAPMAGMAATAGGGRKGAAAK